MSLSLMHPVACTHRVSVDIPGQYFNEIKAYAKDAAARYITRAAKNYGADVELHDIVWVDRGYEIEGIWAGKRLTPIVLMGGKLDGYNVGLGPARDRRGIPGLHWRSGPEWFPPGGSPLVYVRQGIDPETGAWHYQYSKGGAE